jgi:catechol 2,3-dioxygenase-like lactoylglutathione lyase family enzyme
LVRTHGLTHLALGVRDVERAFDFYAKVFGMVAVYRADDFLQAQTPGTRDVLVFERGTRTRRAGTTGGIAHFGFRLVDPADIAAAAKAVRAAGGTITDQGEFSPGEPYLFFTDPEGYQVEIWYELPTPVDPKPPRKARAAR